MLSLFYHNVVLNRRIAQPLVIVLPKAMLVKIITDVLKMVGVVLFAVVATVVMGS